MAEGAIEATLNAPAIASAAEIFLFSMITLLHGHKASVNVVVIQETLRPAEELVTGYSHSCELCCVHLLIERCERS